MRYIPQSFVVGLLGGLLPWVAIAAISNTGITQLTGDVTAGPGNGSQIATLTANATGTGNVVRATNPQFTGFIGVNGAAASSPGYNLTVYTDATHQGLDVGGSTGDGIIVAIGFDGDSTPLLNLCTATQSSCQLIATNSGVVMVRKNFTVATLPSTAATGKLTGAMAYVTDAMTCTFLGSLTGGGTTKCPVQYNGTAWVAD